MNTIYTVLLDQQLYKVFRSKYKNINCESLYYLLIRSFELEI